MSTNDAKGHISAGGATLRRLVELLESRGELRRIRQPVDARFELPALLQQAEQRGLAVAFEQVRGARFPVIAGLLTTPQRFALGLGIENPQNFSRADHVALTAAALAAPQEPVQSQAPACQQVVVRDADIDLGQLPVPTFFEGDSGPFLTAAVGIARNPDNGVINAGFYRVLVTGKRELAVSVGPSSDLLGFLRADAAAGRNTAMALVIGGEPALLMAAASKTPPGISELAVAGGFAGQALEISRCVSNDLPVPARAELVIEISIDHSRQVPNTMGEFGDLYGTQVGHVARVTALTHRTDALFHVIMAGAGREHNTLGFIILYEVETELRRQLAASHPGVAAVAVVFDPPAMGMTGEVRLALHADSGIVPADLIQHVFGLRCGRYDLARVIRRVVIVDADIDVSDDRQVAWAINNRVEAADRYCFPAITSLPGVGLRLAVDATVPPEHRERLRRLRVPGATEFRLDGYS